MCFIFLLLLLEMKSFLHILTGYFAIEETLTLKYLCCIQLPCWVLYLILVLFLVVLLTILSHFNCSSYFYFIELLRTFRRMSNNYEYPDFSFIQLMTCSGFGFGGNISCALPLDGLIFPTPWWKSHFLPKELNSHINATLMLCGDRNL